MGKVTLKEIAEKAGVSLTTVHRVLNGRGGASKEVENRILQIAKELDYTTNINAANLRRGTIHIALVFPMMKNESRFFLNNILQGYLKYRKEASHINIVFQEFYYSSDLQSDDVYQEEIEILNKIYLEKPVHYDGVIVYGLGITPKIEAILNRIVGSGTKLVVLERGTDSLFDVCAIEVNDIIAGNMAADLLKLSLSDNGKVILITQKLPEGDPNGKECAQSLQQAFPHLHIEDLPLPPDNRDWSGKIAKYIATSTEEIKAIYCTSGRYTNSLIHAIRNNNFRIKTVIGSEIFEESYHALQLGTLQAVIDKRPERIGYRALQLLVQSLLDQKDLPNIYKVTPRIILKSNSIQYFISN